MDFRRTLVCTILALLCVSAGFVARQPDETASYENCQSIKKLTKILAPAGKRDPADDPTNHADETDCRPPKWYAVFRRVEGWQLVVAVLGIGVIAWQAWLTRKSVQAAESGVRLTNKNITILLNKERPKITVPIDSMGMFELFIDETEEPDWGTRNIRYQIECYCPTTAFIEDAWANLRIQIVGKEPSKWSMHIHDRINDFSRIDTHTKYKRMVSNGRFHEDMRSLIVNGKAFVHFEGQIRYRGPHLSKDEEPYVTRFHYRWTSEEPPELQWWEKEGGDAENYDT